MSDGSPDKFGTRDISLQPNISLQKPGYYEDLHRSTQTADPSLNRSRGSRPLDESMNDGVIRMRSQHSLATRRSSHSDPCLRVGAAAYPECSLDPRLIRSLGDEHQVRRYPGPRNPDDVFWRPPAAEAFGRQLSWCRDPRARSPTRFFIEAIAIFSNILAGPGILGCPAMVQSSGWVISFLVLGAFAFMTARTSSLLAKALKQMTVQERGVDYPRYELADLVRATFGPKAFVGFQFVLTAGMLLLVLASIVAASQAVDEIAFKGFGNSIALEFAGKNGFGLVMSCPKDKKSGDCWPPCPDTVSEADKPCGVQLFQETDLGITIGYVVVAFLCVPLTFTNFANLMWFQYIAMAVSAGAIVVFSVTCFLESPSPIKPNQGWFMPPAFGHDPSLAISTCFLLFAIGFAVPSWWNDNDPDCPAQKAIHSSMFFTVFMYYLPITFLPAFAFRDLGASALDLFVDPHGVNPVCVAAALALALIGIMPNIIAYSVAMRDNMQTLGPWFTFRKCLFLGCICPWFFGWMLSFGASFQTLVEWSSIGILGVINFIVPLSLVLRLSDLQREAECSVAYIASTAIDSSLSLSALPPEVEPWAPREIQMAKAMLILSYVLVAGGYITLIVVTWLGTKAHE